MSPTGKPTLSKKTLAESVIKSQPGLFILFDKTGCIHWWNTMLEHYSGYTHEQLARSKILDLVDNEDKKDVQKEIDEAFRSGMTDIEIPLKSKNGNTIQFLLTWVAIKLDGEDYIIGTGIDISKLYHERWEKIQYYQILEKSRNEIFMFDPDTFKLVYVNKGGRQNLGYSLKKLKGMTSYDIKPEFNEKSYRDHIRPLLTGKIDILKYETYHQRSDGSRYDVEINLQLVESEDQQILVAIALDITDRLEKEKQLESSLREKELLLGEVHHRVKNNLAIVSSLLNMQAQNARAESVKMLLKESESRVKTMGMIHQMLYEQESFSKIDFNLYLKKLIKYIAYNYQHHKAMIETEVNAEGIHFEINTAVPCALIVNALVINASKHAFHDQPNRKIKVSLTKEQNVNTLIVSDNGIGLPESFNIEESTGLGMTLIRGLTQQLGGELNIQQNGGTTFIIRFKS